MLVALGAVSWGSSRSAVVFLLAALVAREFVERWWEARLPAESRRSPPGGWESAFSFALGAGCVAYGITAMAVAGAVSGRDLVIVGLGLFFLAFWLIDRTR